MWPCVWYEGRGSTESELATRRRTARVKRRRMGPRLSLAPFSGLGVASRGLLAVAHPCRRCALAHGRTVCLREVGFSFDASAISGRLRGGSVAPPVQWGSLCCTHVLEDHMWGSLIGRGHPFFFLCKCAGHKEKSVHVLSGNQPLASKLQEYDREGASPVLVRLKLPLGCAAAARYIDCTNIAASFLVRDGWKIKLTVLNKDTRIGLPIPYFGVSVGAS